MMASSGSASGRGLSVRQLTLIFFGAVAVCAVFFALGFVVGANQRGSRQAPVVEQVAPPSEIPPVVNPPAQGSQPPASPVSNSKASTVVEQDLPGGALPPGSMAPSTPAIASPPQQATVAQGPRAAPGAIIVQVAASRTEAHAQSLVTTLKAHGFPAEVIPAPGGSFFRVQVGPFASREKALETLHKLSREGFRPFIKEQ